MIAKKSSASSAAMGPAICMVYGKLSMLAPRAQAERFIADEKMVPDAAALSGCEPASAGQTCGAQMGDRRGVWRSGEKAPMVYRGEMGVVEEQVFMGD